MNEAEKLSVRIDSNLSKKLREVAEAENVKVSDLIREGIIMRLNLKKGQKPNLEPRLSIEEEFEIIKERLEATKELEKNLSEYNTVLTSVLENKKQIFEKEEEMEKININSKH